MKAFSTLVFLIFIVSAFQPHKNIFFRLGRSKCHLHIYSQGGKCIPVIRLHGDENTCIHAFFNLPPKSPFTLYQLSQKGKRLLEFKEKNKIYFFDPNRMFSQTGIIKL